MMFALQTLELEGRAIPCVVREDGAVESMSFINDLMDLAVHDPEAYEAVRRTVAVLSDRCLGAGLEA